MNKVAEEVPVSVSEQSLVGRLRNRRKELQTERTGVFDIPGYGGELVAKYRVVDWDYMKKLAQRTDKSKHPRKELYAMADTLIEACVEILVRQNGTLLPANEVLGTGDNPLRYDQKLAEALGFKADSARQALFGTISNDLAVTSHHNEVAAWMQDTDEEVDDDLMGESERTR